MFTIQEALTDATHAFLKCGMESPRLEAEVLLAAVLGCSRSYLHAYPEAEVASSAQQTYECYVTRRAGAEPLAYIIGMREFYGIEFTVRPGVLIPRQETEHLVDLLVSRKPQRFADIGTGSGCIAISALKVLTNSQAVAVDISREALLLAGENAHRTGVSDRIQLIQGSLCEPLQNQRFDAIVSNPPYIDKQLESSLRDEVRLWEPSRALFAESNGLAFYPLIAQQAQSLLNPGGLLAFEVGVHQAADVARMITAECYETPQIICDYSGIERVVWTNKIH